MEDTGRMGLEGDYHRVHVLGFGLPHDLVDNVAVSAVHTVKVADAEDRGTEVAGDVVELVEGEHWRAIHRRAVDGRWSLVVGVRAESVGDCSLTTNDQRPATTCISKSPTS